MISYAEKEGTKFMKFKTIDECVYEKFCEAFNNFDTIHERDLQEWALVEAERLLIPDFKASARWLHLFKKRHRIVSRKITKLRTRSTRFDAEKVDQAIQKFQGDLEPILQNTSPSNVS